MSKIRTFFRKEFVFRVVGSIQIEAGTKAHWEPHFQTELQQAVHEETRVPFQLKYKRSTIAVGDQSDQHLSPYFGISLLRGGCSTLPGFL